MRRRTSYWALSCSLLLSIPIGSLSAQDQDPVGPELRVMLSSGFAAAYLELVPAFEEATGVRVVTTRAGSTGTGPNTIPGRLARGEEADLVILASGPLDELLAATLVQPGSRVDLASSGIGVGVREGAFRPDIGSIEGLRTALIEARSIAVSTSTSGIYVRTELLARLGIADQVSGKVVSVGSAGAAVMSGEAELGIQQISELLPVEGLDLVGPLPAEVQVITTYSAGLPVNGRNADLARSLIAHLSGASANPVILASGMTPASRP